MYFIYMFLFSILQSFLQILLASLYSTDFEPNCVWFLCFCCIWTKVSGVIQSLSVVVGFLLNTFSDTSLTADLMLWRIPFASTSSFGKGGKLFSIAHCYKSLVQHDQFVLKRKMLFLYFKNEKFILHLINLWSLISGVDKTRASLINFIASLQRHMKLMVFLTCLPGDIYIYFWWCLNWVFAILRLFCMQKLTNVLPLSL